MQIFLHLSITNSLLLLKKIQINVQSHYRLFEDKDAPFSHSWFDYNPVEWCKPKIGTFLLFYNIKGSACKNAVVWNPMKHGIWTINCSWVQNGQWKSHIMKYLIESAARTDLKLILLPSFFLEWKQSNYYMTHFHSQTIYYIGYLGGTP